MATRYPSTYYSFKFVPRQIQPSRGVTVDDPSTALEIRIQRQIALGNREFFAGRYAVALEHYLDAWYQMPRTAWEWFPSLGLKLANSELALSSANNALIGKAAETIRFLQDGLPSGTTPPVPINPPKEIAALAKKFGVNPPKLAEVHLDRGVALLALGRIEEATKELKLVRRQARNDRALKWRLDAALATVPLRTGKADEAVRQFAKLRDQVVKQDPTGEFAPAIEHNLGVAMTLAGKDAEAGRYFASSATRLPVDLNWYVSHTLNPGIHSFQRPASADGIPILLQTSTGWQTVLASSSSAAQTQFLSYRGDQAVSLDLTANPAAEIETKLLQSRIGAQSLKDLGIYLEVTPQFVTYLAHVAGFVLPVSIGDCHGALGNYDSAIKFYLKARDYKYLNGAIERPALWVRTARAYLRKAVRQYRDRDMASAQGTFENIVKVVNGGFTLSGPLYSGSFAALKASHLQFFQSANKRAFSAIDFPRRIVMLDALSNLQKILAGINYLGFPEDIVPIHSWRYLQNLARYFANQAIHAERAYISFRDSAEREVATKLVLEQAVEAQNAAVEVEGRRVEASKEQKNVAELSADLAEERLQNSIERKADFEATSAELAVLDEINGWATGPMDKAEIDGAWADVLGLDPGTYDTYQVVRRVAALRAQISNAFELRDKQRQIEELEKSKQIADAHVDVAVRMVAVAEAQFELAELRADHAQEQLSAFDSQEFTPELWHALADAQGEISQRYLDQAIGTAFLMERAFEFEFDLEVNRIRFDYARSELQGLLSADFLLTDIDQFSYDRILHTDKQVPLKTTISLADRYPYQFFQEFMNTGRLEFETLLEDFDVRQPGAHVRKLRRVEVIVEGLIGREGIRGTLSNSGISRYRNRQGESLTRVQKPETMLLSLFDVRRDGFVFTAEESVLQLFENSGVASGWTLEIPPEANDLQYSAISNIHLVFYYDAFYSKTVESRVRAELAASALQQHQLGFRLKSHFADEFFALQDTGEVTFALDTFYLPHHHGEPRILEARIVVETDVGVSSQNLELHVTSSGGGLSLDQTTDANGMIATGPAAVPLNVIRGARLDDSWTVRIDETANAAAFAAGFSWEKVTDLYVFLEYAYTPRGQLVASDDFSADPMPDFDVVDDADATTSNPSAWSFDASGFLQQTSNIFGGPAGPTNKSVERPGTYLVRKESAQWPTARDLSLACHLESGDDDGIGLVFRYQDPDNFYFFSMDRQRGVQRLGKKVGGAFAELDQPAVREIANAFNTAQVYDLRVASVGDAIAAFLDGEQILFGRDASIQSPGRVGLFCWGNNAARFHDLELQVLRESGQ